MKDTDETFERVALNYNQILTLRQTKFQAVRANNKKVGLSNRRYIAVWCGHWCGPLR